MARQSDERSSNTILSFMRKFFEKIPAFPKLFKVRLFLRYSWIDSVLSRGNLALIQIFMTLAKGMIDICNV